MEKTLDELARLVGGKIAGDGKTLITGIAGIREAKRGDITFLANRKYVPLLADCRASAVVVSADVNGAPIPTIKVKNPDMAFARIVEAFAPEPPKFYKGVHPTVVLGEDVVIGKDVSIQAFSVIQDEVEIGDGTIVSPGVYVGHGAKIGKNCFIYPRVVIRERCIIGNNCIIHSGTVVGSDGFGFSTVSGVHHKIPQIGIVQIDDDVEIGANVTIDRARFGKTHIGRGTKIDNLVQIAHNVVIGENSFIVAQAGIAGSTTVGDHVILAGQSGVDGHRRIGNNVVVAAKAGVTKDIPDNSLVSGFPAQPHDRELKIQAIIRKLPDIVEQIKGLEERLREIEKTAEDARDKR
ncbi:MAG: UDP-3-O-(3-hydroxymyristoyl)glucosamine N-acyltransferase [Planctomycetota bacterium]|jgi:UDP-3-O-[3-hydroxymyristoyl] glucosamine N-acyltransferase